MRQLPRPNYIHPKYGWVRIPDIEKIQVEDDINVTRNITIEYFENGFKRWGNLSADKKILIIGDSYTDTKLVSNSEEYYAYLEKAMPEYEFFVYGGGGYGTLQEYMILEDYYAMIKPDIILWQFFFNDFLNNYYEFDRKEYPLSNVAFRPYLEHGKIVYRIPGPLSEVRKYSAIVSSIMNIYDKTQRDKAEENVGTFFSRVYGDEFWKKDFRETKIFSGEFNITLNITTEIFVMAKSLVGNTPIYLFSADSRLEESERHMAKQANLTYIPGVAEFVNSQEERVIGVSDEHWNLAGNKYVGQFLADYFS